MIDFLIIKYINDIKNFIYQTNDYDKQLNQIEDNVFFKHDFLYASIQIHYYLYFEMLLNSVRKNDFKINLVYEVLFL